MPSSRGSSQPKDQTQVYRIAGRLYHLSHQGSPRILEWVAYPHSRGSSWSTNWTGVSCIAGGFFNRWATTEASNAHYWVIFSYKVFRNYSISGYCFHEIIITTYLCTLDVYSGPKFFIHFFNTLFMLHNMLIPPGYAGPLFPSFFFLSSHPFFFSSLPPFLCPLSLLTLSFFLLVCQSRTHDMPSGTGKIRRSATLFTYSKNQWY